MPITLEQAKSLKSGQVLYHVTHQNRDGSPVRWIVNGKPKVWKRDPSRVRVPLKHGMWDYDYLTEDCLHFLCLTEEEVTR